MIDSFFFASMRVCKCVFVHVLQARMSVCVCVHAFMCWQVHVREPKENFMCCSSDTICVVLLFF